MTDIKSGAWDIAAKTAPTFFEPEEWCEEFVDKWL